MFMGMATQIYKCQNLSNCTLKLDWFYCISQWNWGKEVVNLFYNREMIMIFWLNKIVCTCKNDGIENVIGLICGWYAVTEMTFLKITHFNKHLKKETMGIYNSCFKKKYIYIYVEFLFKLL